MKKFANALSVVKFFHIFVAKRCTAYCTPNLLPTPMQSKKLKKPQKLPKVKHIIHRVSLQTVIH